MLFFAKLLRPQASLNCGVLDGLLTGNHEIFHNRRRIEQADILKRSCNTDFADLICPQIGYILPEYFYLSAAKRNHSGNKVEQRRLRLDRYLMMGIEWILFFYSLKPLPSPISHTYIAAPRHINSVSGL